MVGHGWKAGSDVMACAIARDAEGGNQVVYSSGYPFCTLPPEFSMFIS